MNSHITQVVDKPEIKKYILVFDVETNGLLPRTYGKQDINKLPYIIQLSFVIYNFLEKKIIKSFDEYIKIPDNVEIPEVVVNLTGIEKGRCLQEGVDIITALEQFYEAYMFCDCLVAHNMDFDEKMISLEIERNRDTIIKKAPYCFSIFNNMYEKIHNIERYCTMKKGTDLCNILVPSSIEGKPNRKKWPKLIELYSHIFNGENVEGLHNSYMDVLVCLRCYLKMRHAYDDKELIQD